MPKNLSSVIINDPPYALLRKYTAAMHNAYLTEWNSYDVITRAKARSPKSTYLKGNAQESWIPVIDALQFDHIAKAQDQYLNKEGWFSLQGSIGNHPRTRAGINYLIEKNFPNIAAMQKQLLFPLPNSSKIDFKVIYTPNFSSNKFPNGRGILVNLEKYVTRIFGTDYFGESKKAGLRMWNKWIFDKGGLAFHAGCKSYINGQGQERSILIIGLSGTGKTTTTFTNHANSVPLQDDFCALFPSGKLYVSENGCFAKTYGLDAQHEPDIYQGITSSEARLENVFIDKEGKIDFFNDTHTTNGRGTFPLDLIPHGELSNIPPLGKILILNKDFNIIPAIAKLNKSQAAAYFMLGETMGTSAGGNAEEGEALRVPGTNPFFPLDHALQANRFLSLLNQSSSVDVYLLNTGHIGQTDRKQGGEKITIEHSRLLIEMMLLEKLKWRTDPDFGYQIVKKESSPIDEIFTNPRAYYEQSNRFSEFQRIIRRVKNDRINFLSPFNKLNTGILECV